MPTPTHAPLSRSPRSWLAPTAALTAAAACLAILAPAQAQGRLLLYRIGRLPLNPPPGDIAVAGGVAYLTSGGELRIVDVADPSRPRLAGWMHTPGEATAVALDGTTAIVADGAGGLRLVEVANAAAPVETGHLALDGPAHAVAAANGIALVALPRAVVVVDYADRTAPREVARLPLAHDVADVALAGGLALVASSDEQTLQDVGTDLHVFDLAEPGRPRAIGGLALTGASVAVAAEGGRAYVAQYIDGHLLVPTPGPAVTCVPGPCTPTPVYALPVRTLPPPQGRLEIVDLEDPGHPAQIYDEGTWAPIGAIAALGARVFVAGSESGAVLEVFDVAPEGGASGRWSTVAWAIDGTRANAIAITDDLVYVASPSDGLLILAVVPEGEPSPTPHRAATRTATRTPSPTVRGVVYVPVAGR